MGVHVEWASTGWMDITIALPGERMPDGQRVDADKLGVVLGGDDVVVIEGSAAGLLAKLRTMVTEVETAAAAVESGQLGICRWCGERIEGEPGDYADESGETLCEAAKCSGCGGSGEPGTLGTDAEGNCAECNGSGSGEHARVTAEAPAVNAEVAW